MSNRFYVKYLRSIKKNDQYVEFTKKDLSYLLKDSFDALWLKEFEKAQLVRNVDLIPPSSSGSFKVLYEFGVLM